MRQWTRHSARPAHAGIATHSSWRVSFASDQAQRPPCSRGDCDSAGTRSSPKLDTEGTAPALLTRGLRLLAALADPTLGGLGTAPALLTRGLRRVCGRS